MEVYVRYLGQKTISRSRDRETDTKAVIKDIILQIEYSQ